MQRRHNMQKILIYIISLTLLIYFTSIPSVPQHALANTQTITVHGEIVNVRQGPGLTYEVIETLSKGDELTVIATEGDWLKVQDGRLEGWVASWLVKTSDNNSSEDYVISQVDQLNIRQHPSISAAVIGQLFTGNEASMLKEEGDWVQIQYGSTTGWVAKMYVTIAAKTDKTPETTANEREQTQYFTITVDAVNVRAEGNLNSERIGIAYRGSKYKVLDSTNNWVQIQFENNRKAWIYSFYGSISGQAVDAAGKIESPKGSVTIIYNGTNIREEASTASTVIERVNAGQIFTIVSTEDDFYKVSLANGQTGYVANWVVSTNGQTGQATTPTLDAPKEKRKSGTLHGITLVIDAGHGGNDHGTTGVRGTREKDITLLTAEKLTSKLRAAGATVYLTRESDNYVDLRKRVAISHQVTADAFISIHYDANEDVSFNGFTTYYTNSYQRELADYVHKGIANKLTIRDRGVQYGNYLVLRENRQKSILIELGFLSNASEERTITTDYYREQATLGIYEGILQYFDAQL